MITTSEAGKIVMFIDRHFGEKEIWINPKICPKPIRVAGHVFKPVEHITGVVVFGDKCPLSNQDVNLEVFLMVISFMESVKNNGVVSFNVKDLKKEKPVLFRKSSRVYLYP